LLRTDQSKPVRKIITNDDLNGVEFYLLLLTVCFYF
jgi:hypothetical protein